jgi:hypothetical protein
MKQFFCLASVQKAIDQSMFNRILASFRRLKKIAWMPGNIIAIGEAVNAADLLNVLTVGRVFDLHLLCRFGRRIRSRLER